MDVNLVGMTVDLVLLETVPKKIGNFRSARARVGCHAHIAQQDAPATSAAVLEGRVELSGGSARTRSASLDDYSNSRRPTLLRGVARHPAGYESVVL